MVVCNVQCMFNLHVVAVIGDWSSGVSVCLRPSAGVVCPKMAIGKVYEMLVNPVGVLCSWPPCVPH